MKSSIRRTGKFILHMIRIVLNVVTQLPEQVGRLYLKILPTKSKAKLMGTLPFLVRARFHKDIVCYIASGTEYKRSQQVLSQEMIDWIQNFREDDVFYDIGANIGMVSLFVAKECNERVKVVAFEPSFSTFTSLTRNVQVNHLGRTVSCFQVALGESSGLGMFNYAGLEPGDALHTLNTQINYRREIFEPVFQQPILSFSLDNLIEEFNIPVPTHVKIDVDGTEWEILQGFEQTLKGGKVSSIFVEIVDLSENDERTRNIVGFFERLRYQCQGQYMHNKTLEFPRISDYLFVKT
jgi:FkbM family methyltransferase